MIKRRNYTFALTQDNDRVIEIVKQYPKYAYIKHDKDNGTEHYHYYVEFPNPRSLKSLSLELGIPENMLQQVYNKTGILEYLTHKNESDKHHYDESEIFTNMDLKTEVKPNKNDVDKDTAYYVIDLFDDYYKGKLTYKELMYKLIDLKVALGTTLSLQALITICCRPRIRNVELVNVPCSVFHNRGDGTDSKQKGGI